MFLVQTCVNNNELESAKTQLNCTNSKKKHSFYAVVGNNTKSNYGLPQLGGKYAKSTGETYNEQGENRNMTTSVKKIKGFN